VLLLAIFGSSGGHRFTSTPAQKADVNLTHSWLLYSSFEFYNHVPIRVANIDTPEVKGRCAYELDLAIKARDFTASLLMAATTVELKKNQT